MGVCLFLFLWSIAAVIGLYEVILGFIPYIILAGGIFWFSVGLILNHVFKKHHLYEAGQDSPRRWINILSDILRWLVRIDIYGNGFLIIGGAALAVIFYTKGIVPML